MPAPHQPFVIERFVEALPGGLTEYVNADPYRAGIRTTRTADAAWLTDDRRAAGWRRKGASPAALALSEREHAEVAFIIGMDANPLGKRCSMSVKRTKALRKAVRRGRVSQIRKRLRAVMG